MLVGTRYMPTIYGGGGYGGVWDQIEHPPTMYIYSSLEKKLHF